MANRKRLIALPLSIPFVLTGVITAHAATYYVAPTGSDSNSGTSAGAPFLTIQKCIASMTAPGDVCTVADGTYSVPSTTYAVGTIGGSGPGSTAASGTPTNPNILKSTNPLGARIVLHNGSIGTGGFYLNRSYWIIEGFDISGGTSLTGNNGITVDAANGTIIRKNSIHHIARTVCSMGTNGNTGIYTTSNGNSTTIQDNKFYSIGRLRSGENGCVNSQNFNDHGIYLEATPTVTIMRNVFWDTNRGWPIHVYKSGGGTTSNLNIYNNTFSDQAPSSAPARPEGHIILASTVLNATIKNNISYDGYLGFVHCPQGTFSNVVVDHNLSDSAIRTTTCAPGILFGSNMTSMNPDLVAPSSQDYRLQSGSPAIDSGVMMPGIAYSGSAPDIGAYEFGSASAAIAPPKNLRVQ